MESYKNDSQSPTRISRLPIFTGSPMDSSNRVQMRPVTKNENNQILIENDALNNGKSNKIRQLTARGQPTRQHSLGSLRAHKKSTIESLNSARPNTVTVTFCNTPSNTNTTTRSHLRRTTPLRSAERIQELDNLKKPKSKRSATFIKKSIENVPSKKTRKQNTAKQNEDLAKPSVHFVHTEIVANTVISCDQRLLEAIEPDSVSTDYLDPAYFAYNCEEFNPSIGDTSSQLETLSVALTEELPTCVEKSAKAGTFKKFVIVVLIVAIVAFVVLYMAELKQPTPKTSLEVTQEFLGRLF